LFIRLSQIISEKTLTASANITTPNPRGVLLDAQNDLSVITNVSVVVHKTTVRSKRPHDVDNHWVINLYLGPESFVQLNMFEDESKDLDTTLEWRPRPYNVSFSTIKLWSFAPIPGLTIKMVADVLYANRRDQYIMSGGGSGCRYWV
jgi:hypothetical protein